MNDLIDLDTLVAVKKAAPKATQIPFDRAQDAVAALVLVSRSNPSNKDFDGQKYWNASLKELTAAAGITAQNSTPTEIQVSSKHFGSAYRSMGLTGWREMDGFRIAWSEAQLKILKKYFRVEERK